MTSQVDKKQFFNSFTAEVLDELGLGQYIRRNKLSLSDAIYYPKETDPRETSPTYPQFLIEFDSDEQRLCCSLFTDQHDVYLAYEDGLLMTIESIEREIGDEKEFERSTISVNEIEYPYGSIITKFKMCAELVSNGDYDNAYRSINSLSSDISTLCIKDEVELPDDLDLWDQTPPPLKKTPRILH